VHVLRNSLGRKQLSLLEHECNRLLLKVWRVVVLGE